MEKYNIDRYDAPGKHTGTLLRRFRSKEQANHFLKKLSTKITNKVLGGAEKRALNEVASKVGDEKAAEMLADLKKTEGYNEAKRKTINAGSAVLGTALALGAVAGGAAAAGAGGAGGGGAAAGGAAIPAGAKAAGAAGLAAAPVLTTNRKPTSDIVSGGPQHAPALPVTPLTDQAKEYLGQSGINSPAVIEELQKLETGKTAQAVKNIANSLPPEIKKQITTAAKKQFKKPGFTDIVSNGRTSPELLPKTRQMKRAEDILSKEAVTDKDKVKENEISISPWLIGGVVLGILVVMVVALR